MIILKNISQGDIILSGDTSYTISIQQEGEVVKNESLKMRDTKNTGSIPANEIAAISLALHLCYSSSDDGIHDEESNVITIKRIERRYSPWNSKFYGFTNLHR